MTNQKTLYFREFLLSESILPGGGGVIAKRTGFFVWAEKYLLPLVCTAAFLWAVSFLILGAHNPFIYFQF